MFSSFGLEISEKMKIAKSILESFGAAIVLTLLLVGGYALLILLCSALGYAVSGICVNLIYAIVALLYIPLILFLSKRWNIHISDYLRKTSIQLTLIVVVLAMTWFSVDLILFSIQDYRNLLAGKLNIYSLREFDWDLSAFVSFIHTVLLGPIVEEIFFRVLIFTYLSRHFNLVKALLLSSFLFVLVHFRFDNFLSLFLTGGVLTYLFYKKQSLLLNILFHSVLNFIFFTFANNEVVPISDVKFTYVIWNIIASIVCVLIIFSLKNQSLKIEREVTDVA